MWLTENAPELLCLMSSSRLDNLQCEGYRLSLVGHSLGAGVAAVLAAILQPTIEKMHCYAYSCPSDTATLHHHLYLHCQDQC